VITESLYNHWIKTTPVVTWRFGIPSLMVGYSPIDWLVGVTEVTAQQVSIMNKTKIKLKIAINLLI
jgi:hypothetical protein